MLPAVSPQSYTSRCRISAAIRASDIITKHCSAAFTVSGISNYVIAYAWQTKPIQVIAVIHGARDLAALFSLRPVTPD